jgi:hypothetical protein
MTETASTENANNTPEKTSSIGKIITIVVINVLVIVVLLEVGLRLLAPVLPPALAVPARYVMTGQPYAEDWQPAWQQNRDHYYALRTDVKDELQYGSPQVSFRLTTTELWEGAGIGFRTDPVDFFVDAVVVGDSFGLCFTERQDCWVDMWRNASNLGVVNLSQPVTGTTSHYRILRDFGAPMTPPLVVWQFFGNDFNDDYGLAVFRDEVVPVDEAKDDDASEATSTPLQSVSNWLGRSSVAYAIIETLLTGRFSGTPEGEDLFIKPHTVLYGENDEHIMQFGGAYELQALDMDAPQNQIGYDLSREAFTQAQALVASWEGDLVVILMPTREEVYRHLTEPIMGASAIDQLQSARTAMHRLCDDLTLTCYDPYDVFVERALAGEALYHVDDMHLNPHGNAVLAEALQTWFATSEGAPTDS